MKKHSHVELLRTCVTQENLGYDLAIPANFFWDISARLLSRECRDFWRRHDHFRRFPKMSKVIQRRLKSYELTSSAFHFKNQRSRGRNCHLSILHMVFVPYMGLSYIFLEVVSSKTAATHIFESGVRNWPAGVSPRGTEVFNPQAWDSRLRRESWQVYLACQESSIAQWLERPTAILEGHGFDSHWETQKFFFYEPLFVSRSMQLFKA